MSSVADPQLALVADPAVGCDSVRHPRGQGAVPHQRPTEPGARTRGMTMTMKEKSRKMKVETHKDERLRAWGKDKEHRRRSINRLVPFGSTVNEEQDEDNTEENKDKGMKIKMKMKNKDVKNVKNLKNVKNMKGMRQGSLPWRQLRKNEAKRTKTRVQQIREEHKEQVQDEQET